MESYKYWKTSEVRYLKDNVNLPMRTLSKELGRSRSSIVGFMHKNNIHSKKTWTDKDIEFIKTNLNQSYSWFARHFGVTKNAFGQLLNSRKIKFKDLREWKTQLKR